PRSSAFWGRELHHGYSPYRLQTAPYVQNRVQSRREVRYQSGGYRDTTTTLRREYAFLPCASLICPAFPHVVSLPLFRQCPEPICPWRQQFCHPHSAAYKRP